MKYFVLIIFLFFTACNFKNGNAVKIAVDRSHTAIILTGLPLTTLQGMQHDSLSNENFQTLFPVYKMPADTEMRNYQTPLKGRYRIAGTKLSFKPDTPFAAGQTYFARWYHFDSDINTSDLLTNKRKPGQTPFTEVSFKIW